MQVQVPVNYKTREVDLGAGNLSGFPTYPAFTAIPSRRD